MKRLICDIFTSFGVALIAGIFLLTAFKAGYDSGLESAQQHVLTINPITQNTTNVREPLSDGEKYEYPASVRFVPSDLSKEDLAIYMQIIQNIYHMNSVFQVEGTSYTQLQQLLDFAMNSPDVFWINGPMLIQKQTTEDENTYIVSAQYTISREKRDEIIAQIENTASSIMNKEFESAEKASKKICDWLQKYSQYAYTAPRVPDVTHETSHILGPLLEGRAICSGYAKTMSYLLGYAGYASGYCIGWDEMGNYHAWNEIENMQYIDPTKAVVQKNMKNSKLKLEKIFRYTPC